MYKFIINIIVFLLLMCSCKNEKKHQSIQIQDIKQDTIISEISKDSLYGIEINDFHVIQSKIPKNKTLSNILSEFGVTPQTIHLLAEKSNHLFDVRKIKFGNNYCLLATQDSSKTVKHFIYEISPVDYIVYSIDDSIKIRIDKKEIKIRERIVEGTIESSLWNAVAVQNIPVDLAFKLSDIYAWNIDFFGLQKGDDFKAHYTEMWVDSTFIGIDSVKCAVFNHYGKDYYAIPFLQNERVDYFDFEGNSLRKAFLKAPLKYSRVSSTFSHSRLHPVLKIRRPHYGVDYAAPVGTPVMSIGDGRVVQKGYHKGGGHTLKVQHNGTYTTVYMHLSKHAKGINVGSVVRQGDVIGYVGSTGLSTGPHLDFRVYKNGKPTDPLKMESPSVEPVNEALLSLFFDQRDSLLSDMKKKSSF